MKAGKLLRRVGLTAAVLVVAAQFVPVRRDNPPVAMDVQAPPAVKDILRAACYDCHSNETRWPWYSRVAPVSWWLADHVHEGRKDLNFSRWPILDFEAQRDAREDIVQQIEKGEMPLASYRLGHPEARLDAGQKAALLDWARGGGGARDEDELEGLY